MKKLLVIAGLLIALPCATTIVAQSQNRESQVSQSESKVKNKHGKSIVRDKSKPIRKALEDWYARNVQAFNAKDTAALMALRTEDFHTLTPDGKVNTRADMEARTRRFLDRIDHFILQDNQIGTIEVDGDLASAEITQRTVRMQRFPDGTLHKVEGIARQRETWKKTAAGWKLYRVDNIRDGGLFVDDKPFKPNH